jgi:diamine N-acetyltransferase
MTVKTALVSDAPTISFLGRKTFTETFGHLFDYDELNNYLDDTFNISKLEHSLSKNQNIFGILHNSDKPIGYYKVKIGSHYDNSVNEDFAQLQKIYVLRDYLDLKLGNIMLDHIMHLKEIVDCKTIWLVVLSTNSRAVHFYLKQGFKKIDNYYHTIGSRRLEYDLMTKNTKNPR